MATLVIMRGGSGVEVTITYDDATLNLQSVGWTNASGQTVTLVRPPRTFTRVLTGSGSVALPGNVGARWAQVVDEGQPSLVTSDFTFEIAGG